MCVCVCDSLINIWLCHLAVKLGEDRAVSATFTDRLSKRGDQLRGRNKNGRWPRKEVWIQPCGLNGLSSQLQGRGRTRGGARTPPAAGVGIIAPPQKPSHLRRSLQVAWGEFLREGGSAALPRVAGGGSRTLLDPREVGVGAGTTPVTSPVAADVSLLSLHGVLDRDLRLGREWGPLGESSLYPVGREAWLVQRARDGKA